MQLSTVLIKLRKIHILWNIIKWKLIRERRSLKIFFVWFLRLWGKFVSLTRSFLSRLLRGDEGERCFTNKLPNFHPLPHHHLCLPSSFALSVSFVRWRIAPSPSPPLTLSTDWQMEQFPRQFPSPLSLRSKLIDMKVNGKRGGMGELVKKDD